MNLKKFYLIILFTIIGLGLSIYLGYLYSLPEPVTCIGDSVNSCETVRYSEHSYFFGVRLPIWGILYFATLLLLEIMWLQDRLDDKGFFKYFGFVAISGFIFETYKTLVQFIELNAICIWCTFIELAVVAILITVVFAYREWKNTTL